MVGPCRRPAVARSPSPSQATTLPLATIDATRAEQLEAQAL
jgi:hypothetical protein